MDARAESYARQVDRVFREGSGIAYSMIGRDLERSGIAPRLAEAYRNNLAPADFYDRVRTTFGLKTVAHPDAVPHNRRLAALVEFAAENDEWAVANNGSIYRDGPNGIERIAPAKDPEGRKFGFAAYLNTGGAMEVHQGEVVALTGDFQPVTGGIDIDVAIERLEQTYGTGMRM